MSEPADFPGLSDWDGASPVILTTAADYMPAIAANYPRACVAALPAACRHLTLSDAWGAFLWAFQADLTLWPVQPIEFPFTASLVPVLSDAGVKTLRLATRALDDYARLHSLKTLWRDLAPHPGPPAGALLTLQYLRAERRKASAALLERA